MEKSRLLQLLEQVRTGEVGAEAAALQLRDLPFDDLGYAMVDHHRELRQGVPEVILGQGKTPVQIAGIAEALSRNGHNVLITRLSVEQADHLTKTLPVFHYNAGARVGSVEVSAIAMLDAGPVGIVTAGTSDLPVADECAETLRMLGARVERITDVGVAGIHRLLHRRDQLLRARVLIVIAGMEGALPSVVGGLVAVPVIAVPTSVGYGAAFGGVSALLGMLNSCASGITVVNIDNGFGAAFAAVRMLRPHAMEVQDGN